MKKIEIMRLLQQELRRQAQQSPPHTCTSLATIKYIVQQDARDIRKPIISWRRIGRFFSKSFALIVDVLGVAVLMGFLVVFILILWEYYSRKFR